MHWTFSGGLYTNSNFQFCIYPAWTVTVRLDAIRNKAINMICCIDLQYSTDSERRNAPISSQSTIYGAFYSTFIKKISNIRWDAIDKIGSYLKKDTFEFFIRIHPYYTHPPSMPITVPLYLNPPPPKSYPSLDIASLLLGFSLITWKVQSWLVCNIICPTSNNAAKVKK